MIYMIHTFYDVTCIRYTWATWISLEDTVLFEITEREKGQDKTLTGIRRKLLWMQLSICGSSEKIIKDFMLKLRCWKPFLKGRAWRILEFLKPYSGPVKWHHCTTQEADMLEPWGLPGHRAGRPWSYRGLSWPHSMWRTSSTGAQGGWHDSNAGLRPPRGSSCSPLSRTCCAHVAEKAKH